MTGSSLSPTVATSPWIPHVASFPERIYRSAINDLMIFPLVIGNVLSPISINDLGHILRATRRPLWDKFQLPVLQSSPAERRLKQCFFGSFPMSKETPWPSKLKIGETHMRTRHMFEFMLIRSSNHSGTYWTLLACVSHTPIHTRWCS